MIFLYETKMKNHIINGVPRRMGYLNGYDVPSNKSAGGLSLWWDDSLEVKVVSSNKKLIHTKMPLVGGDVCFHAS